MKYLIKSKKKTIESYDVKGNYKDIISDDEGISYHSNYINDETNYKLNKNKYICFIKKHMISILSLLIILLFIINLNFCFINIKINALNISEDEKSEILDDISSYYDSFFVFKYLDKKPSEINLYLKSKYYQYEFINVYKKGINLIVEIRAKDKLDSNIEDNIVGDLYASESGIIYSTYIKKGVLLVEENFYVNKGDLLVSGNLKYNINKIDYVKASGFVIACTFNFHDVKVKKNNNDIIRSGRIESFELYKFQNKNINSNFDIYETEIKEGKYFFSKDKVVVYELIENKIIYSYDEALEYAKSIVESDFNERVVHEDEKILEIILHEVKEDDEYYYYTFLVKALKNIAYFKEYVE